MIDLLIDPQTVHSQVHLPVPLHPSRPTPFVRSDEHYRSDLVRVHFRPLIPQGKRLRRRNKLKSKRKKLCRFLPYDLVVQSILLQTAFTQNVGDKEHQTQ